MRHRRGVGLGGIVHAFATTIVVGMFILIGFIQDFMSRPWSWITKPEFVIAFVLFIAAIVAWRKKSSSSQRIHNGVYWRGTEKH